MVKVSCQAHTYFWRYDKSNTVQKLCSDLLSQSLIHLSEGVSIRQNGMVEWNDGMERWNGMMNWNGGMEWNGMTTPPERAMTTIPIMFETLQPRYSKLPSQHYRQPSVKEDELNLIQ